MGVDKKKIISFIASVVLSATLINFGAFALKSFPENKYIGIITILIGFALFYFSIYSPQIKKNEVDIKDHEKRLDKLEKDKDTDEKLLNTIKDIVILNNTKK